MIENEQYLTEQNLGEYLNILFPGNWIHNKAFITLKRPDYRNDDLKMIVEFDGPKHYTQPSRILADHQRDAMYLQYEYQTIRIPMFIQLTPATIKCLFNIQTDKINMKYKNGFISDEKTLIMPAEYCELGIIQFKKDLEKFKCVKNEIIDSLKIKVQKLKDINLVLPPSLHYLLN